MIRSRHPRWYYAAWVALLAVCMIAQPVLAGIGELHEAFSHANQAAFHLEQAAHQHDAAETGDEEPADTLHTLLHFAHCCGHSAAINPAPAGSQGIPGLDPRPVTLAVAPRVTQRTGAPFRPPIPA